MDFMVWDPVSLGIAWFIVGPEPVPALQKSEQTADSGSPSLMETLRRARPECGCKERALGRDKEACRGLWLMSALRWSAGETLGVSGWYYQDLWEEAAGSLGSPALLSRLAAWGVPGNR